jgi:hypothetical protein
MILSKNFTIKSIILGIKNVHSNSYSIMFVQVFLQDENLEPSKDNIDVIKELARTFENMGQYEYAVKFYLMIENITGHNDVSH